MIIEEIQNVLKSLPAFLKIWTRLQNPMSYRPGDQVDETDGTNWLDTATHSLWFTIPFCFVAFYGLVPHDHESRVFLLVVLLFVPLTVAWLGSFIGFIQTVIRGEDIQVLQPGKPALLNSYLHDWVIALMVGWFYVGVILVIVELVAIRWLGLYPNTLGFFHNLALASDTGLIVIVSSLSVCLLLFSIDKAKRGTLTDAIIFAVVCFVVFAVVFSGLLYAVTPTTFHDRIDFL